MGSLQDGNRNLTSGMVHRGIKQLDIPPCQLNGLHNIHIDICRPAGSSGLTNSPCAMQVLFDILMFMGCRNDIENQNGTINLPYHLGIHDSFHGSPSLTLAGMAPIPHFSSQHHIFCCAVPVWSTNPSIVATQPHSEYLMQSATLRIFDAFLSKCFMIQFIITTS